MHETIQRFVDALHRLHADRDTEPLAALFANDATLSKLDHRHEEHGQDGARQFWAPTATSSTASKRRSPSLCRARTARRGNGPHRGTLRDGTAFSYRGVSVLQGREDKISSFRTYYDSAAFLTASRQD